VHVLLLNRDGSVKQTVEINSSTTNGPTLSDYDTFGTSLTSPGDLDGDGVNDLAVGAGKGGGVYSNRGAVHVLLLNRDGSVKQTVQINSSTTNGPSLSDLDLFGSSLTSLGDLDGDGVNDLAVGAYQDDEGGKYRGAVHILFLAEIDTTPPTVTVALDDSSLIAGETATVTFTFSEAGVDFAAEDVTVENGVLSGLAATGDPLVFTATFTPDAGVEDATNVIRVGTTYTDAAGNAGAAGVSANYAIDTLAPTVTVNVVDAALNVGDKVSQVTFEFSEAVTGFDASDVSVNGGVLSNFMTVDADSFTATFTASDDTEATGSVSVGTGYTDTAGNTGSGGSGNVSIDTLAPTVVITPDGTTTSDSPIVFTFQFSEAVSGFVVGDVSITNGTAGTFTPVDGDTLTLAVTPAAAGDVSVSVSGGAAQDTAGNDSGTASATVTFQSSTGEPVDVTLPGAAGGGPIEFEVLRDGADLVVRQVGGSEVSRQTATDVSVLRISGSAEDDVVTVLNTGIAVDTPIVFTGEDGNDRFDASLATGNVNLTGNGGDDVLIGGSGNDTLNGGSGKDELVGNTGDDLVQGQGSTGDTLDGGDGNDTLNGGSGNDLIREFFSGNVTLTNSMMTGRGTDTVISAERAMLTGGGAAQLIDLSAFFTAGLTSSIINAGGGDDTILATDGGDIINGGGGSDLIIANGADDRVFGGSGADTVNGGAGNDFIKGLGGSGDQLIGGPGNDTLNGGRGVDRVIASADADFTLTVSSLTGDGNDVLLALEIAEINAGDSDNLIDVSAFIGFRGFVQVRAFGGNDTVIGSAGPDVINGGDGNDSLVGNAGNDVLNGDAGNDTLLGKEGDDTLNGGDDNDGLSGADGNDVINGDRGFDRAFGGMGNDTLTGGNARDTLIGGDGDDSLEGNDGPDTLVGGTGNNDASVGDVFNDATATIDEAFKLDPLPPWVDQV
ncbi:hypothetical protein GC176_09595, partial [bacterium]|nr:hypothetical protein [bacterium]